MNEYPLSIYKFPILDCLPSLLFVNNNHVDTSYIGFHRFKTKSSSCTNQAHCLLRNQYYEY